MNHTTPPEPTAAQIAEWWDEARDVHADNPGLAPIQLARRAAAWGWKARGVVKHSLTAEAPADPIRAALERLVIMASNELASGQLVYSQPEWNDAIAAARAAALLDRQATPVPVPVSERLPEAEDCDAEGRCWVYQPHYACPESPAWELMLAKYASPNYEAFAWLPAHALPLPSGEATNG